MRHKSFSKLSSTAGVIAVAAIGIGASGASAATVGQTVATGTPGCVDNTTYAQNTVAAGNSYAVPLNGVVNSFSTRAYDPNATRAPMRLVVHRNLGGGNYRVVGVGSVARTLPGAPTVSALTTSIAPIAVQAGDRIGFVLGNSSGNPRCAVQTGLPADAILHNPTAALVTGQTLAMVAQNGFRLSIAANLRATTTLVADPTSAPDYVLSARLRDSSGAGVAGRTVNFRTVGGDPLCSDTTNAQGVASCTPFLEEKMDIGSINENGYNASFAGTTGFLPSSAHGVTS